jgi:hypothetical protein
VCENIGKNVAKIIFVKIKKLTFSVEKSSLLFWLLLYLKNCTKETITQMGENLPNLVTLVLIESSQVP